MSDDIATLFGVTEADADAIMERAKSGELTEDDQAKIGTAVEAVSEALPQIAAAMNDMLFFFPFPLFDDIAELIPLFNEWLAAQGIRARLVVKPTYRIEPIPGAELGGKPRNPEADVIDEIGRIVDWQLKNGQP